MTTALHTTALDTTALHRTALADSSLVAGLLARCHFPSGAKAVDCAVSGGADSSALAVLAFAAGLDVHLFHVDHGTRDGSEVEADMVADLALRLGGSFSALRCRVEDGPDLEARSRLARHSALPDGVLFGHTMDDQAETVLLRLMRGTGPAGLAAMRPSNHPILGIRRSETEELCRFVGIEVFEDPSNADSRFTRNRVRGELLPLMSEIADRDVVPLLARLAGQSAEQAELISALAGPIDASDAVALGRADRPLAAVAIREWWTRITGDPYPPNAAAIDRILKVARGESKACEVSDGWKVLRTNQKLRIERAGCASDCVSHRD